MAILICIKYWILQSWLLYFDYCAIYLLNHVNTKESEIITKQYSMLTKQQDCESLGGSVWVTITALLVNSSCLVTSWTNKKGDIIYSTWWNSQPIMKFWLKAFWKLSFLLSCSIYLHDLSKYLESVACMAYPECGIHFKYEITKCFNLNVMCTIHNKWWKSQFYTKNKKKRMKQSF